MANLDLNFDEVKNFSEHNKLELVKTLSKRANTRMKSLEKNEYDVKTWAYGKAQQYIKSQGRTNARFYEGVKYDNERELNKQLMEVMTFLNARTSTVSGVNEMLKQRFETFSNNRDLKKELDFEEPLRSDFKTKKEYNKAKKDYLLKFNKYYEDFYDFVKTKQLDLMKKQGGDSGTFMDDFAKALQQGFTVNEIMEQYAEYTNGNLTFDQVQEKYERAEWQLAKNGGKLFSHGTNKGRNNKRRKK